MTTPLQQALLDDDLDVVQKKIRLGTYPHAVYARALAVRAWACARWVACTYPMVLSHWDWGNLAQCSEVSMPAEVVQNIHDLCVDQDVKDVWARSAVAWESRGVQFSGEFYKKLWSRRAMAFKTCDYLVRLGGLHRFEAVQTWLDKGPVASEVERLMKRLWDHAILHCDDVLLNWLSQRTPRDAQMQYLYAGFTARGLALPSSLARRGATHVWTVDLFLEKGLVAFDGIEHFCQYVALYDTQRLRHMWLKLEESERIPAQWREFFASLATRAVGGHEAQRLVLVLRGMYPDNEAQRMLACAQSEQAGGTDETYLVDLL